MDTSTVTRIRAALAANEVDGAPGEIEIGDVLNRRADLSTFLVHLTKGDDPKASLLSILADRRIRAQSAMGWASTQAAALGIVAERSQRVACLSETPLDQIHAMYANIARRRNKFKPYGLAFTKMVARRNGANPVWYVNVMAGVFSPIVTSLNGLRVSACFDEDTFVAHPASKIFPFFEWMGTGNRGIRHEFWWEREWRSVGDFAFSDQEIALVLCPEADHADFEAIIPGKVIDPAWGLERTIAKLVGLSGRDVSPFT